MSSLRVLAEVEKAPSHSWSSKERVLLCILFRFYDGPDPVVSIPKVFNDITKLKLKARRIVNYFQNHMSLV